MLKTCRLCETRRPRRHCPGIRGDICSICCGTHREITVDCPLDCEYLKDAHHHERLEPLDPEQVPNREIEISERFVREHEDLIAVTGRHLLEAALETTGTVDLDVREALEALARTYKTLESGLLYETRPTNPIAAGIQLRFKQKMDDFRRRLQQKTGMATIRDADLLGTLVFLQRIEYTRNNGRKRGRAFLSFLASQFPGVPKAEPGPRIIV